MPTSRPNHRARAMLSVAAALWLSLGTASAAIAQAQYDNNCRPIPEDEINQFREQCNEANIFCRAGQAIARYACPPADFLRKLKFREENPQDIDAEDLYNAARPDGTEKLSSLEYKRQEKKADERLKAHEERRRDEYLRSNPAEEAARERNRLDDEARLRGDTSYYPPTKQGRFGAIFQGDKQSPSGGAPSGDGYLISDYGIARGTFKDGRLQGTGQEILPDGVYRGGEYVAGKLEGEGYEVARDGDRLSVTTGVFINDAPNGVIEVSFDDGSSRLDIWERAHRAIAGVVAPPGMAPAIPTRGVTDVPASAGAEGDVPVVLSRSGNTGRTMVQQGIASANAWDANRAERESAIAAERLVYDKKIAEIDARYRETVARIEARAERDRQREANGGGFDWGNLFGTLAQTYVSVQQTRSSASAPAPSYSPQQNISYTAPPASNPGFAPGPVPPSRQRVLHDPALEATQCVQVIEVPTSGTRTERYFKNSCAYKVSIIWGDINKMHSLGGILPGGRLFASGVDRSQQLRFAACRDDGSAAFNIVSEGSSHSCRPN